MTAEFERQVENLVGLGYPAIAGLSARRFRERLAPLAEAAAALEGAAAEPEAGRVPFVIALKPELADPERAIALVRRGDRAAVSMLEPGECERWQPVEGARLPAGGAYLATGIETGRDTLDVRPNDALGQIARRGRSPLTLEEGIALVTHHPEALARNACFYMLGSRRGDKRVVALWISKGAPKLGWCWAGNPHTWLGSASCANRVG